MTLDIHSKARIRLKYDMNPVARRHETTSTAIDSSHTLSPGCGMRHRGSVALVHMLKEGQRWLFAR
ncbi:MAG TPA: hypothetical protein PKA95_13435, partial [Thermomicrobiales bacterium]|nr:hypothetical protein [Thermomicrobiales bacterium]